eukprot:TRINITY_DN8882_c0_g1_i1.p1 TRINITY_DN8882_c0_g1~~TRINITY_DN8882_c0_g1_i1.p1  ORF type:complete len:1287 (+),score=386.87 TRINITY_DN8882_c0_g1_i1:165-4025(+)
MADSPDPGESGFSSPGAMSGAGTQDQLLGGMGWAGSPQRDAQAVQNFAGVAAGDPGAAGIEGGSGAKAQPPTPALALPPVLAIPSGDNFGVQPLGETAESEGDGTPRYGLHSSRRGDKMTSPRRQQAGSFRAGSFKDGKKMSARALRSGSFAASQVSWEQEQRLEAERKAKALTKKRARREEEERRREQENREVFERRIPVSYIIQNIGETYESKELLQRIIVFAPFLVIMTVWSILGRGLVDGMAYYSANSVADMLTVTGGMPAHTPEVRSRRSSWSALRKRSDGRFAGPKFHKTFFDVGGGGHADFYDYVEGIFVEQLWDKHRDHGYLPGEPHYVMGQVELLGSALFRTIKVRNDSCERVDEYFHDTPQVYWMKETGVPVNASSPNEVTVDWSQDPYNFCYAGMKVKGLGAWGGVEDRRPYGDNGQTYVFRANCEYAMQELAGEYLATWPCGGYELHLPFKASHREAMRFAYNLRQGGYVNDHSTRLISIEFFTYDWSVQIFTAHKYFWEVTEGGTFVAQTQFRNFLYFSWEPGRVALDAIFLCFVIFYCIQYWTDYVKYKKRTGRGFISYFFDLWAMWEFINLISFLCCFIFRGLWMSASLENEFRVPYLRSDYPEFLNYVVSLYIIQAYFNAMNIVVTYLKLLKFVRMHPKLNVLTRTLGESAENIVVVLVVFLLVLFAYAVAANTIFGSSMVDFKDINTSFSSCMRILLGDFDYSRMREENRAVAYLWFGSFNILALFLLLNFIIAVISTAFSGVQQEMAAQPSGKQFDDAARTLAKIADRGRIYAWCYRLRMWTTKPRALIVRDRLIDWKDQQRKMGAYKGLQSAEDVLGSSNARIGSDQWEDITYASDLCLTRGTGDETANEDYGGFFRAPRTFAYICPLEQLFLERPTDANSVQELRGPLPLEWREGVRIEVFVQNEDLSAALPRVGTVVDVNWKLKNIPRDFFSEQSLNRWLDNRGDHVVVSGGPAIDRPSSLYYRSGLRNGQRIVGVYVDNFPEKKEVTKLTDALALYENTLPEQVFHLDVEPRPEHPQIKVKYARTWRNMVAVDMGLLSDALIDGEDDYLYEWLDLEDPEQLQRIVCEHDPASWEDPKCRRFQMREASICLDNIWYSTCQAWRAHKEGVDTEVIENYAKMQEEVLQKAFEKLFEDSQERIDAQINKPIYGWVSTDFDPDGHVLDTKRVVGGFSDAKLTRICQIYGNSAPGLRGAEERVADIDSLLVCLHLFAGNILRKLAFVYEKRRQWAKEHGFRISEPALPPAQVLRENDVSQWSQFVTESAW